MPTLFSFKCQIINLYFPKKYIETPTNMGTRIREEGRKANCSVLGFRGSTGSLLPVREGANLAGTPATTTFEMLAFSIGDLVTLHRASPANFLLESRPKLKSDGRIDY